ncbi:hypothetical protein HYN59_09070 [Flavobacterium album]|uniref:Reverse transcriptase domain-containing protein n=1 Tax=Flavobacterium album TaxID=2175091 RepID=A0A2S1QXX0_9FLAO|nr:reverse transcriptase domain-containing protein [Flavobacterium album]AWH85260.1 hypothetical protein HYN59_09070 [Flavobacterium album]
MIKNTLYTEELWESFVEKNGKTKNEFNLKTYPQLDPYFNFLENSSEIKNLISDPTLKKVSEHSFLPFIKILTKTPRYRYQEDEKNYGLETKIRPISFASHFDSYIYAYYSHALTERYQKYIKKCEFDKCVLAYRSDLDGKCNIQFAKEIFNEVEKRIGKFGTCSAIALDITGYFDNIDHFILKNKWCKVVGEKMLPADQYKIFRSLTKYSYINKNSILKHFDISLKKSGSWSSLLDLIPNHLVGSRFNDKLNLIRKRRLIVQNKPKINKNGEIEYRGIPQGSPMSAVLSNIYLIDFDEKIFKLSKELDFVYRRYCDDILIICHPENAENINKIIIEEIKSYSLIIQPKKTELITFKKSLRDKIRGFNQKKINKMSPIINAQNEQRYFKNLQYLGFEFNGENIYIRPGSLSRYFRKMKGRIIKSIMMSYSDKSKRDKILKKQIFERYSHFGKRNFLSYAIKSSKKQYYSRSAKKFREGMNSVSIRRQLSSHFAILEKEIISKSNQRFDYKEYIYDEKIAQGKRAKRKNLKL